MRIASTLLLLLSPMVASAQAIYADGFEDTEHVFFEPFTWSGNHASTIGHDDHVGSTVWWNEDNWDVRGDTGYLPTAFPSFPAPIGTASGYHIDIHKSETANPHDGRENNDAVVIGGDGTPGVAAMRINYQGISSARLRNPLLISEQRPGVVEFYAPKFVTTAHWWEIALTPATSVTAGENTAVPAQVAKQPFEDSLNFVAIGHDDIPCDSGWHATFEVHRSIGGGEEIAPLTFPSISQYPTIDPAVLFDLAHWKLEFRPSGVDLYADLDANGSDEFTYHYNLGVPWPEVNVHLLGVAYQADHHPQGAACYQGLTRELVWRHVTVRPVKYAQTSTAPRNLNSQNLQRTLGWQGYDTRDIQRFGPAVGGVPQANPGRYVPYGAMAFASIDLTGFGGVPPTPQKTLNVTLSANQINAARRRLVYDIKGRGNATLTVNNTLVGALPDLDSIRYFAAQPANDNWLFEWGQRSIEIPAGRLVAGSNSLRIDMTGEVVMDRVHLEFGEL
jgi:hypothetical protein